jgi:hypothetical protein
MHRFSHAVAAHCPISFACAPARPAWPAISAALAQRLLLIAASIALAAATAVVLFALSEVTAFS